VTTVLPKVTVEEVGAESWVASLAERWNVGRNQNGGVVLAAASTALGAASGQPDPMTVTGHYLRPTAAGIASIRTELIRQGRTTTVAMAELW
jgi:acyl-coenzyme A thioesterase PaaI-like protein